MSWAGLRRSAGVLALAVAAVLLLSCAVFRWKAGVLELAVPAVLL